MSLKNAVISTIKEILNTAIVSLAIFLVFYVFLIQPHRVKGESMTPNLRDGELILTEKVSYRFSEPKRGDIIVFKAPGTNDVDYIKRIIGLPDDQLIISNGAIYVNGRILKEKYETQSTNSSVDLTIPSNEYFVLGDNRAASSDSRTFGPIKRSVIEGRAWVVYWPLIKLGNYNGTRVISRADY